MFTRQSRARRLRLSLRWEFRQSSLVRRCSELAVGFGGVQRDIFDQIIWIVDPTKAGADVVHPQASRIAKCSRYV